MCLRLNTDTHMSAHVLHIPTYSPNCVVPPLTLPQYLPILAQICFPSHRRRISLEVGFLLLHLSPSFWPESVISYLVPK